jgi:beta-alanine degradation protein BauB
MLLAVVGSFLCACATRGARSFGDGQPPQHTPAVRQAALDPALTDGDKYHVVLENEHVRVLRYHDQPGAKTHQHHHDEFVLYALSSFRRRLIFPDGSVKERDFKPGDVIWMPEQVHIGENIGTTDTEVLIVEQKPR